MVEVKNKVFEIRQTDMFQNMYNLNYAKIFNALLDCLLNLLHVVKPWIYLMQMYTVKTVVCYAHQTSSTP